MSEVPPARVLLVGAEPMVLRILEHKLRREGYEVTRAEASAPPEVHAAEGCDVALIDVGEDRPGWREAAAAARPRAGWLAVVDGRDPEAGIAAMSEGAAGVVAKPFKPTAVAGQVRTLLSLAAPR